MCAGWNARCSTSLHVHACVYMLMCMYVCMYVCMYRMECSPLDLLTYTLATYPLYVALELPEWDLENKWKPHVSRNLFAQVLFFFNFLKSHESRTLFVQVYLYAGREANACGRKYPTPTP